MAKIEINLKVRDLLKYKGGSWKEQMQYPDADCTWKTITFEDPIVPDGFLAAVILSDINTGCFEDWQRGHLIIYKDHDEAKNYPKYSLQDRLTRTGIPFEEIRSMENQEDILASLKVPYGSKRRSLSIFDGAEDSDLYAFAALRFNDIMIRDVSYLYFNMRSLIFDENHVRRILGPIVDKSILEQLVGDLIPVKK